jgi:MFS family permease
LEILALLCLISLLAYVFRQNVSIAGLAIRTELGLTDLQLSWILSSAIWGYALFQLPGGLFGQVVGPRLALTAILVLWSLFTMLSGVLPGTLFTSASSIFVGLLAMRFLLGASQGPLFPIVGGTVAAWFRPGGLSERVCCPEHRIGDRASSLACGDSGLAGVVYLNAPASALAALVVAPATTLRSSR